MYIPEFRAYAPDLKQMIYLSDPKMCFAELKDGNKFGLFFTSDSMTVCLAGYKYLMHFSGKYDSNKKKIFQDDIANITTTGSDGVKITERGIMRFNSNFGQWGFEIINSFINQQNGNNLTVEVIGNIHQHPHLIPKDTDYGPSSN